MLEDLDYYNLDYTVRKEVKKTQKNRPEPDLFYVGKAADRNEDKDHPMVKHGDIEVVTSRVK